MGWVCQLTCPNTYFMKGSDYLATLVKAAGTYEFAKDIVSTGSGENIRVSSYTSLSEEFEVYYSYVDGDIFENYFPDVDYTSDNLNVRIENIGTFSLLDGGFPNFTLDGVNVSEYNKIHNLIGKSSRFISCFGGRNSYGGPLDQNYLIFIEQFLNDQFGVNKAYYQPYEPSQSQIARYVGHILGQDLPYNYSPIYVHTGRDPVVVLIHIPFCIHKNNNNYFVDLRLWGGTPWTRITMQFLSQKAETQAYPFPPIYNFVPIVPSDPGSYTPDSPSGQTGGQNSEPPVSGLVDLPPQPEISALSSGMIQLYNPSREQVIQLGKWLWNKGLDLESLKKIFSTPMDVILGLSILPVSPSTDPAESVIFGNIDSGIEMRPVSSQYMTKNMGTLTVPMYYNSYLDYEPYTKIELFLPYIGCKTLSADEVMGKTLSVDYRIDVLSGACVAFVSVDGDVLYQYGGSLATQIPITSQNYQGVIQGVLGAVGSVVGGIVGLAAIAAGAASVAAPVVGATALGATALASSAHNVMSAKQRIDHSGGINGSTGIVGGQYPYLVITRPKWHKAANQPHFTGYPGFFYATVSELNGFTQFVNFEFTRVHATDDELKELEDWFINKGVRLPDAN